MATGRSVQMGRTNIGDFEIQYSQRKLNFNILKTDVGHLHNTAR